MKMLLVLTLIGVAAAGRLENTYLPPQDAALAGGQDLPLPSRNYLPANAHTEAVQKAYEPLKPSPFTSSRTTFSSQAPVNTYLPPAQTPSITSQRVLPPTNSYLPPTPGNSYLPPQQESNSLVVEAPARSQQAASQRGAFSFSHSQAPAAHKTSTYGFHQQSTPFAFKQSSFASKQAPSAFTQSSFASKQAPSAFTQSSFASKQASSAFTQSSFAPKQAPSAFTQTSSKPLSGYAYSAPSAPTTTSFSHVQQPSPISSYSQQSAIASKTTFSSGSQDSYSYPQPANPLAARQQAAPTAIIRSINENNGDGVYRYSYETENGILAEEQGQLRQDGAEGIQTVQGGFSYTGPDNVRYTVTYTADENGFQASGEHLPTPPPIPEAILRSLEQNAREEAEALRTASQQGYQYNQAGSSGYHY